MCSKVSNFVLRPLIHQIFQVNGSHFFRNFEEKSFQVFTQIFYLRVISAMSLADFMKSTLMHLRRI
jgi:hypothetical protein